MNFRGCDDAVLSRRVPRISACCPGSPTRCSQIHAARRLCWGHPTVVRITSISSSRQKFPAPQSFKVEHACFKVGPRLHAWISSRGCRLLACPTGLTGYCVDTVWRRPINWRNALRLRVRESRKAERIGPLTVPFESDVREVEAFRRRTLDRSLCRRGSVRRHWRALDGLTYFLGDAATPRLTYQRRLLCRTVA